MIDFDKKTIGGKKLIIFDLDGTLTPSKSDIDSPTAELLLKLLRNKAVAIIGGGSYEQFQKQLLKKLGRQTARLKNLYLFPTTSTSFYRYEKDWRRVYREKFSSSQKKKIMAAFERALERGGYVRPSKIYGKLIEDRRSQITFSALGQDVVAVLGKRGVALKGKWRRQNTELKLRIAKILQKLLPEFEVRAAGYTSIDVTRKGIDKAYGIRQIKKNLGVPVKDMLFIGDALFPGGNDYAARRTGVDCIQVSGPKETNKIINLLLRQE